MPYPVALEEDQQLHPQENIPKNPVRSVHKKQIAIKLLDIRFPADPGGPLTEKTAPNNNKAHPKAQHSH